jgi:hypothetical protein
MKTPFAALLLASAAVLPLAVSAQEATPDPVPSPSLKSREEVRAELEQARASGALAVLKTGYLDGRGSATRSRADVMAEVAQARASGELAQIQAEAPSFTAYPVQDGSRMLALRPGK